LKPSEILIAAMRAAWPDATPGNSNWLYVMGNGYLKTGWFGGVKSDGSTAGFDPTTGKEVPGQSSDATSAAAGAAVAYAVARGDMKRVRDLYTGPAIEAVSRSRGRAPCASEGDQPSHDATPADRRVL
jgi:hypothetical protein